MFDLVDLAVTTFSVNVEKSERVDLKGANPFSFYHVVTELEEQDAYGIL